MDPLSMLATNPLINIMFISWFIAQILKVILTFITHKKIQLERLIGAGGMPSSHSSLVCSLCVGVLRTAGFKSPLFAISIAFAAIVMYDATGVRRAAGEHAKMINILVKGMLGKGVEDHKKSYEALKEYLGHTPLEVFGGAILGISIGIIYPL